MDRLNTITDFVKRSGIVLVADNDDGRVNSITNEEQIIELLQANFDYIYKPQMRKWYDMAIRLNNSDHIYINIKVSNFENSAADNISAKLGMGYALTGIKNLPASWKEFNRLVANNLRVGYDYYFLVVDKSNIRNSYWTSLKRIDKLVANGNNLPFQCNWSINRTFSQRSELEAMKYILSVYVDSWDKKANGYPHEIKRLLDNDEIIS